MSDTIAPDLEEVPQWVAPTGDDLVGAIEAMLFASGDPLPLSTLVDALAGPSEEDVRAALERLRSACRVPGRGLRLEEVATGWQLRTDVRFAPAVLRLRGERPTRLSRSALEVLALVAYEQPVTRTQIEEVRGVRSGPVLKGLLDRGLVRVCGRREEPGRPLEDGTTDLFLETFGLPGLRALPALAERDELD